jgi:hypothetical protein
MLFLLLCALGNLLTVGAWRRQRPLGGDRGATEEGNRGQG